MYQEKGKVDPKRGRKIIRPIQNFGEKSPPAEKKLVKITNRDQTKVAAAIFLPPAKRTFQRAEKIPVPRTEKRNRNANLPRP